jgi:hypothetical protein
MKQLNIEKPTPKTRKPTRVFNAKDKHNICTEWQKSGLSKHRFCKAHNLCQSMLTRWLEAYNKEPESLVSQKSQWVPIYEKEGTSCRESDPLSVEITLSNSMVLRTTVSLSSFLSILQEACNATAIVRS